MADYTQAPPQGMYHSDSYPQNSGSSGGNQLVSLANFAGAAVSLLLIAGIAVWGYKLMVRDVSGIPVVRAASGEMRVRPEDPGGQLAQHQGLAVNAVAAEGAAAAPADRLILAPPPIDLTAEDRPVSTQMVAQVPQPAATATVEAPAIRAEDMAAALETGNVEDLVARLTEGVPRLSDEQAPLPSAEANIITETVAAEVSALREQSGAALSDAPGLRASLRPQKRPAQRADVTPAAVSAVLNEVEEIDPASLPAGTRLAQLGAFDSAEVAREQWDVIRGRFDVYMTGKRRIVQRATSGGRVFYRLRAMGFDDIADARRFCAALVAANADCIPVVTR